MLYELQPNARGSAREPVDDEEQLRAHDVLRRRIALADAMLEDQAAVELRELRALHARPLANADPGGEPVDELSSVQLAHEDRVSGTNAVRDAVAELYALAPPRDAD